MKKRFFKTVSALLVGAMLLSSFTGCAEKEPETVPPTVTETPESVDKPAATEMPAQNTSAASPVNQYFEAFKAEIGNTTDISALVTKVNEKYPIAPYSLMQEQMQEGFLMGFDADITGFTNAYALLPLIGSVPFILYVFETDDADSLMSSLKENANPGWNICTMADDVLCEKLSDNVVLFVMSPNNFDE